MWHILKHSQITVSPNSQICERGFKDVIRCIEREMLNNKCISGGHFDLGAFWLGNVSVISGDVLTLGGLW